MKKSYLIGGIFILICNILPAQDDEEEKREYIFGFEVNPGVSWFNPDSRDIKSDGSVLSFGFGATVEKKLTENISFTSGIGAVFNGGKLKYPDVRINKDNNDTIRGIAKSAFKNKYVNIPFRFKGKTNQIGYITYFLEFGGSLGINYKARMDWKWKRNQDANTKFERGDIDIINQTNLINIALNI
ncbi:MAG: outer membrane beta-barrel protein, partial [Flavobacteriales bacterium]